MAGKAGALLLVAVVTGATVGCGANGSSGAHYSGEMASVYDQCKTWAKEGHDQSWVGTAIGTYTAANNLNSVSSDQVSKACADGYVAGGGS